MEDIEAEEPMVSNEDVTGRQLGYLGGGVTEFLMNVCSQFISSRLPFLLMKRCAV